MILFHGNGEDLGALYTMADHLRHSLKMHILVPEYPGYGIYRTSNNKTSPIMTSAELILRDALTILNYFTSNDHMGARPQK